SDGSRARDVEDSAARQLVKRVDPAAEQCEIGEGKDGVSQAVGALRPDPVRERWTGQRAAAVTDDRVDTVKTRPLPGKESRHDAREADLDLREGQLHFDVGADTGQIEGVDTEAAVDRSRLGRPQDERIVVVASDDVDAEVA